MSLRHFLCLFLSFVVGAACATCPAPPPPLWDDPEHAFAQIGYDYIPHMHDCDDMVMEFRDHLVFVGGVDPERIRIIVGKLNGTCHCWLEAQDLTSGKWWVFDPASGVYSVPRELYRLLSTEVHEHPGNVVIDDGTGYRNFGDRWWCGRWFSEEPR